VYFRLHKNNKIVDMSTVVSNLQKKHLDSFLCSLEYKSFWIKILHVCGYIISYFQDFSSRFFETCKHIFRFFLITIENSGAREHFFSREAREQKDFPQRWHVAPVLNFSWPKQPNTIFSLSLLDLAMAARRTTASPRCRRSPLLAAPPSPSL
jgi:hypothetical protein